MVLLGFLHINVANTTIMYHIHQLFWLLSDLPNWKSLTLSWRSFVGWGNEHVAFLSTYKDGQYFHLGRMWQRSPVIAESVSLKIIDTPLTLTLKTY